MGNKTVTPLAIPFDSTLPMPGSKSECNRALVAAALSPGETVLKNINPCDDVKYMVEGLKTLGCDIELIDETTAGISGLGHRTSEKIRIPKSESPSPKEIFCGNAGTTVRFLTALASIIPGNWIITGDEHMQKRPIQPLIEALTELGVEIESNNGCPPVKVKGGTLSGNSCNLDASKSSQYLTALLLIAPAFEQGLTISLKEELTSPTYVDLTCKLLSDFGVSVDGGEDTSVTYPVPATIYAVDANAMYIKVDEYHIEGDWSAIGSFLVLSELSSSRIDCPNIDAKSLQGDAQLPKVVKQLRKPGDQTIDCTSFPDQLMNLAVLAAHRDGTTHFTGAANLRHKECDRLAVITEELSKTGIKIEEHNDGITVHQTCNVQRATLNPHHDHRMAMAFAILGSLTGGIEIQNPDCVSKSYPRFFSDLAKLKKSTRCIAITGMRACGKSNLGKQMARKMHMEFYDTDKVFEDAHGPIGEYVDANGWDAFRTKEEDAVAQSLAPGRIVSLGGGAIESARTRELLKKETITIWMQSTPATIIKRLKELNRPALTEKPLETEVKEVMKRREPFYEEISLIRLPARIPFSKHVSTLQSSLKKLCSW